MFDRLKQTKRKVAKWVSHHQQAVRLILVGLVAVLFGLLVFIMVRSDQAVERTDPDAEGENQPAVEFVASPLTGLEVTPDIAERAVLAVQIENSPDARPQSGLSQAGVVFEAIAEAGITRFSAYYLDQQPAKIGPIRSLRPYYIDWALGFDAAIANTGMSDGAQRAVNRYNVKSISDVFYRASDRFAPHNAYSSYSDLYAAVRSRGYTSHDYTPLERKEPAPLEEPTAASINVNISSSLYNVSWQYDADCNCYPRTMGGAKHVDRETGDQISPKVVVVMKMGHSILDPSDGNLQLDTIGTGNGFVFQDGGVTRVTWRKASRGKQITFTDRNGEEVALNPGQTWFIALPINNSVTYKP